MVMSDDVVSRLTCVSSDATIHERFKENGSAARHS